MEASGQLHTSAALPSAKVAQKPLNRGLCELQEVSGTYVEEKNLLPTAKIPKPRHLASSIITTGTEQ